MNHAVVVGGGPAGAALATRLAREGRDVALVEREPGPTDKVCGEFLSREAALYLGSLGLDVASLGAEPIDAVRLCERGRVDTVRLPCAAWSLSRRTLDASLLALAKHAGAKIRRGAAVSALEPTAMGFRATLDDGNALDARAVFLATGQQDLRGVRRPSGRDDDLVAFKIHWRLARDQVAELARHVELILFEGGYAGLSPVEDTRANLCLLVRRRRFTELGQRWDRLLTSLRAECPQLHLRLSGGTPCWPKPLAMPVVPRAHLRRHSPGIWHVGDQAVMLPSFSGDGVSIALHSAELAARIYLDGGTADVYQRRLVREVGARTRGAASLSHELVGPPLHGSLGGVARTLPGIVAAVASHTRAPLPAPPHAGLRDAG